MANLICYEDPANVSRMASVTREHREVLKQYIAKTLLVVEQKDTAAAAAAAPKDILTLQRLYCEVSDTDMDLMPFRHNAIYVYIKTHFPTFLEKVSSKRINLFID